MADYNNNNNIRGGGQYHAAAAARRDNLSERAAKRIKPDPTMTITTAELHRAREIRQAVEASSKLSADDWSDYDYAQHAITAQEQEDMDAILARMYKLKAFKREYKIEDSPEEGVRLIQQMMELMPGYLLSVDFAPRYGSYIFVLDYAAFRPELLQTLDAMRLFLACNYYIFECLSTNLKAVRSGVVFITECQDMTNENFDWQVEDKKIHHLFGHYPFRHKECLWLNTPVIANVAYGLMKPYLSQEFLSTWRLGCKLNGYEGRIDGLFKMPTLEIAQEQMLSRVEGFLNLHERHSANFRLVESMVENPPPPPPANPAVNINNNGQAAAAGAAAGAQGAAQDEAVAQGEGAAPAEVEAAAPVVQGEGSAQGEDEGEAAAPAQRNQANDQE